MKIRKLTPENYDKATALLRQVFPGSNHEVRLVENFHKNGRVVQEWVCIHINRVIAYVAFSRAYKGGAVCGWHLGPLAVKPEFQGQGLGSELLRFALRQEVIRTGPVYVLGAAGFYGKFGFVPCVNPVCPFTKNKGQFLSLRNETSEQFTIGYEPEFNRGGHG